MAKHSLLLLLVASAAATTVANSAAPTAYDMLEKYGFPRGILPVGVQDYVLHPDGSFEVFLPSNCEIYVAGYALQYSSHVRGNVQSMSIDKLDGVSVKLSIKWVGISDVKRDGDRLIFEAGLLSRSFSLSNFAERPRCKSLPELTTN